MLRTCTSCGKNNRLPAARVADTGRCGACKAELPALAEPLDVDSAEFKEIVSTVKVPVLVDFWAGWCGPCRMVAPTVSRVARDLAVKAIVLKVNSERHPDLAQLFRVRGIPNFAVLKDGDLVLQQSGVVSHQQLKRWLTEAT
ncbi:MAG: thiol reductase thioredoxin [Myxococcales bacterium FL481]|nr:MAG: thiol reductase thioredoxin [Myxococcales bacterium FL481]